MMHYTADFGLQLRHHDLCSRSRSRSSTTHAGRLVAQQYQDKVRCASSSSKSIEALLCDLQSLSAATGSKNIRQKVAQGSTAGHGTVNKLLAKAASKQDVMSLGQLCRFAFILTRLQDSSANITPLWQAVLRRLLQVSTSPGAHKQQRKLNNTPARVTFMSTGPISGGADSQQTVRSSDTPFAHVTYSQSGLQALLQSHVSAGDVLYLLRALAAWQGNKVSACASSSSDEQEAGGLHVIAAVVAAASHKASTMALKELLLSVTALAQLNYFEAHIMATASTAFVDAVAVAGSTFDSPTTSSSSNSSSSSSSGGGSSKAQHSHSQQQQQQQEEEEEILPRITDNQLVVNYLWANASLGYAHPLLLQAGLQLLLTRGLLNSISKSHLPLYMWALAALLVCQQQQPQGQLQAGELQQGQQQPSIDQQQLPQMCEQQQQQLLVQAVAAVHNMLAAQANQLWQASLTSAAKFTSAQGNSVQRGSAGVQQSETASGTGRQSQHSSRNAKQAGCGSLRQHMSAFTMDSRRQMYQSHVWIAAVAADSGAVDSSTTHHKPTPPPAAADSLLWPVSQLLAEVQQQQQQQPATAATPDFWQYCGKAWLGGSTQVSRLQREVFETLQGAGLHPVLEFPAQPVQHLHAPEQRSMLQLVQHYQYQEHVQHSSDVTAPLLLSNYQAEEKDTVFDRQMSSSAGQAADSSFAGKTASRLPTQAAASAPGFLSIDIACVMPARVLRHAQQQGLKAAVAQLQEQNNMDQGAQTDKGVPIDNSSSGGGSRSSASTGFEEGVLVAVEVDGPTHVAVNCAGHQLGATMCRNWLLRQWGWEVLVLPWWDWQGKQPLVHNCR